MDWDRKAHENLLPLSKEQDNLEIALKEWHCTLKVIDHITPSEICQLCENTGLRYHYEIRNDQSESQLWVGSSCVLRFNIAIYDEYGELLIGRAREKRLSDAISTLQTEKALESLRQLWKVDKKNRELVAYYVDNFKQRNGFEPRQLLFLFHQLRENEIEYEPAYYKLTLRSSGDQDQLLQMSEDERTLIWSSLSPSQIRNYPVWQKKKQESEEALKKQYEQQIRLNQEKAERLLKQQSRLDDSGKIVRKFEQDVHQARQRNPASVSKRYAQIYGKQEATCILCGQVTDNWWYHNGATNTCKCNECRELGRV